MLIALTCQVLSHRQDPVLPDAHLETAKRIAQSKSRLLQVLLAWVSVIASTVLGWAAIIPVTGFPSTTAVLLASATAAILISALWATWRAAQIHSKATPPTTATPESPDDDVFWRQGLFYVDSDYPRVFVPSRIGVGLSLNFGHPRAYLFLAAIPIVPWIVITLVFALQ